MGLGALGVVKLESAGLAVQIYPEEPPLTVKVVELPEQIVVSALVIKPAGSNKVTLVDTVVPLESVTEIE